MSSRKDSPRQATRHHVETLRRALSELETFRDLVVKTIACLSPGRLMVEYPLLRGIGFCDQHPDFEYLQQQCAEYMNRVKSMDPPLEGARHFDLYEHPDLESELKAWTAQSINGEINSDPVSSLSSGVFDFLGELGIETTGNFGDDEERSKLGGIVQALWAEQIEFRTRLRADLHNLSEHVAEDAADGFDPKLCLSILDEFEHLPLLYDLKASDLLGLLFVRRLGRLQSEIEVLSDVLQGLTAGTDDPKQDKRRYRINEEEANEKVRNYIRDLRSRGCPIEQITRDGVAKATGLSSGIVSGTQAWRGLAAEKRQQKMPDSPEAQAQRLRKSGNLTPRDREQFQKEAERKQSHEQRTNREELDRLIEEQRRDDEGFAGR